jgi:hypothetical protein
MVDDWWEIYTGVNNFLQYVFWSIRVAIWWRSSSSIQCVQYNLSDSSKPALFRAAVERLNASDEGPKLFISLVHARTTDKDEQWLSIMNPHCSCKISGRSLERFYIFRAATAIMWWLNFLRFRPVHGRWWTNWRYTQMLRGASQHYRTLSTVGPA